jgi:hypothetical protein
MSTFKEANQGRVHLKMKLCNYAWYQSSDVLSSIHSYYICVAIKRLDSNIKDIIPKYINGVPVKIFLD